MKAPFRLLGSLAPAAIFAAFLLTNCSSVAQPGAGSALHFSGTNDYVSIPHSSALNAYPLTITAWIKTARVTSLVDGIITKYFDASFNGYSLNLRNGNLYALYLRSVGNGILVNPFGLDGGFIADGQWHHIAFVISASGGSLYVDGNLRSSTTWAGAPGPPTGTEPLQFGRYHNYPNSFQGELDDIALWNRALSANELNYLKHRHLSGTEDGLVGYWRFNEGSGATVNNSATNAFHGDALNSPSWVSSHAAVALDPISTNCLRFNGASGYVQVAHGSALNAYPLSATAWFRTVNGAAVVQGVVGKYVDASGNGWAMIVQNGRLRAFYARTFADVACDITSAATVSDGGWHHAALVVDASGGKLYLDGALVGSSAWFGAPGPPTSTEPLQIGRYFTYAQHFQGTIDEVALWNRALSAAEIQTNRNLLLAGTKPNLVAYWRLDEGTDASTTDLTGHGHTGTLLNAPAWTGSTAYLGDGSLHLIASPGATTFNQSFAVNTVPGKTAFNAIGRGMIRRFHDFGPAPANLSVTNRLSSSLQVAGTGAPIAIQPVTSSVGVILGAYNASSPQLAAGVVSLSTLLTLQPPPGVQLDSVNDLHQAVVAFSHNEGGGAFTMDGTDATDPTRLLHFNGHLFHGEVDTIFTNLITSPTAGTNFAPTHQSAQLQIATDGAYLVLAPAVKFGGVALNVNLAVDGTATNVNGTFNLASAEHFFETAGIRYRLPGLVLNSIGASATSVQAWFPTGFGMQTSTNSRVHLPFAARTNVILSGGLVPTDVSIVFTAASYNTNLLWFSEETKPLIFGATQIEWRIAEGEFQIPSAQAIHFVRQHEDQQLANLRLNLVEPLAGDRVSNDGYYRNAVAVAGAPIYVRPDTNGIALLTLQVGLQENEYRPHFPYINRNIAGHIPVVGGSLVISNDLIDQSASYLMLAGPAPLPYARDCSPEASCTGVPTIGAQVLSFTAPAGHLGLGEFTFTPDGGLLAYGSIPPTNLTWGFIGGANYAQRTSDVQQGAYHIAGTFLRGDQTTLPGIQRPAALLFSGWGNATNSNYVERPGTPAYGNGFGNYAGLNFRAPAQGRSFIAGQDTGLYPLTSRSKYYARFGGISGIHESASFPANLALYGYAFSFTSYRLSYLDSDNWESRTDGIISLPNPSSFTVEFERMKFLCRGNLDSARLPANIPVKHMLYWNTDLKPLSLQFKPKAGNACSLTERYLVLGVETKLPFIPQAFHAALGFKANGNLTTLATDVEGVDSRFPVPAQLSLQGPGGSTYPLTTAAQGYFNNWETPDRPTAGFYSLVGRVRVPFFRDTKVHLHVTPTGPNTSQISIMGGWPAEEGITANRGWRVGAQDYFNTPKFDANHDAWPGGVALNDYRTSPDENYRPRAQRNWIDVALFDYPLTWNPVLREFSGFVDSKVILPVIDVDSRLKQVTPGKVDLDFAQDLNLQLPRIKVLDFANDALNEINSPINTLSNAIRQQLTSAVNTAGLTTGFRSLQNVLRENAEGFFRPVLDPALNPVVDNLYLALANELAVSKNNLLGKTPAIVGAATNGLHAAIQGLNGAAGQANSVLGQLDRTLKDVDDTLGLFIRVLEKDGSGNRHVVRVIIQKLAEGQGPALGFVANLSDSLVAGLLTNLEPTLAKVEGELRELRRQFNEVRMQVGRVTLDNDFAEALEIANHTSATFANFNQLAGTGVSNLLSSVVGPAGDYFTADPARAKREIRERLIVAFLSSSMSADYQTSFRQFLYDKNFLLDQLMDVLFDQVNRSIRNGLSEQIAGATDGVFGNMKGGGLLSGSLLSAKIRGAPTFQGDSMRKIHLDSEIKMNMPDEMKFMAYMDIKELNSQSTALSCIPAGAPAAEVTLGAKDIPLDWLGVTGGPLTLSIEARWTLQSGAVLGVGGSLEVKGKVGFKGGSLNDFGASLAIGQLENYFAAKAGATVVILGIPVDFTAGIFAGKSCSLDPLIFIDPEAPKVLIVAVSDFSGIYLQFGGGLSLSDILFGGSSCLLDVGADITSAIYYQGGAFLGSIGGRQKIGVNVDLICIISASAEWATAFRLDSVGRLALQGEARLCGKVGWCPACLKACKSLTVTGVLSDSGVDYDIDF